MNTLDSLLLQIVNYSTPSINAKISKRDAQVLKSFATSISVGNFLTQNQGNLLIKILKENAENLPIFKNDIYAQIALPRWSKPFRQIEQVKKLYIKKLEDSELVIAIEFTFSSEIRKLIQSLSKNIENLIMNVTSKFWICDLTEHNIVALVEALTPLNFEIDETIQSHYNTIKSWVKDEIANQFLITSIIHPNFQKHITDDLGLETAIDDNVIIDRSVRYKYIVEDTQNFSKNLTEQIARRSKTNIFVDNSQHSLSEVFTSLVRLRRLPIMVVFEQGSEETTLKNMKILSNVLEEHRIFDQVGIYFRLPNTEIGKQFNQLISEKSYNSRLDDTIAVVGIQGGKIPKFFLKNQWRPMSIIGINTKMGLRHGKISVYSNCCDCIVEWADQQTMFDKRMIVT